MRNYRFHFIGPSGTQPDVRDLEYIDELRALADAAKFAANHTVEVWDGQRCVARIQKVKHPKPHIPGRLPARASKGS